MNWKRGLGVGLIFIGFFICLTAGVITGAVIGFSSENYLGLFGVFVLVGGILLLLIAKTLEEIISVPEFEERIEIREPDSNKISLILDTSAISVYPPHEVEKIISHYKNVFVPNSVLGEIHNPILRKIIEEKTEDIEGYEKYREVAKKYLEKTEKPILKRELLPYLNGEKHIKSGSEKVYINRMARRIRGIMAEEGLDSGAIGVANEYALSKIRNYLERRCKVSDADVDVLAMALYEARYGQHAIIGEKDIDFRQAIDLIKKEHPKLGKNLDYVEVYEKELAAA